jgi:uridine kinase
MKPFVIGICGGSGSGKTTLLKKLSNFYGQTDVSVLTMDNYYLPIEEQIKDENGVVNFDLPSALNETQLSKDLEQLVHGNPIEVKEYFFNSPPNKNVLLSILPKAIIIVEGLFVFHYPKVISRIDFSVFVEVDASTQLDRRIYRDQDSRGYSQQDIIYQWNNHVIPCYESYLLPYKFEADFLYRNDINSDEDFLSLTTRLLKNRKTINEG